MPFVPPFRDLGLAPSDAAIILGENGYTSPYELWCRKLKKPLPPRPPRPSIAVAPGKGETASERGRRLEPLCRSAFEEQIGKRFPKVSVECEFPALGFLRTQLDGYCVEDNSILECKSGNIDEHIQALKGTLPRRYWIQIQTELLIVGADRCFYASYCPDSGDPAVEELAIVEVEPDMEFIRLTLLPELLSFWKALKTGAEPKREVAPA